MSSIGRIFRSRRARAAVSIAACLLALGIWRFGREIPPSPAYRPYSRDALAVSSSEAGLPANLPTLRTDNYALGLLPDAAVGADGDCEIYLTNPETNGVYLLFDLRLAGDGTLLYRTGLLAPGKTIVGLPLSRAAVDLLAASGDRAEATLRVYSFATESYASMGEISISLRLNLSGKGAD